MKVAEGIGAKVLVGLLDPFVVLFGEDSSERAGLLSSP